MTRESSKENVAPPDAQGYETQRRAIEALKAEISTLRYDNENAKSNAEIQRIQQENELRRAKELADEEFKKKQAAESEHSAAVRQLGRLQQELDELRRQQDGEKAEIERRARAAEEQARLFQEQLEDLAAAKDEAARLEERKFADLNAQLQKDANKIRELEDSVFTRDNDLEEARKHLNDKDGKISEMEAEVLRLKAQTGDAETMAIIRRELSEQVAHIRTLEATNREQLTELRHLRQSHKAVAIVEEEKASLQRKLEDAETTKAELASERWQRERLEAERHAWSAYLEREGQAEFDSPEGVARALVQERINSASLLEKVGSVQVQLAERDATMESFETEKAGLLSQIEKLKANGGGGSADKARQRLERQRALAEKESRLLREQLKMYESEDATFQPDKFDEEKGQRIQKLEELVDEYKAEVKTLESQMAYLESSFNGPAAVAGTKRPAPTDEESPQHAQIGQLARKNRILQDDLDSLRTKFKVIEKELSVARDQLAAARRSSSVRVLELRDNPTARHEAVKQATIDELRTENEQLRTLVHDGESGITSFQVVPVSTLVALQRDVENAKKETASAKKQCQRLKEVWKDKSDEFKEAVFALLGWHVTFIPTNKMRVESVYYASETDEHERSITFDGDRGSMKFGGGPRSEFAMKLSDLTKYWVREKNCIPGFLAALTLEFYEQAVQEGRALQ
ncbi:MAD-domain-containing protein [Cryphonectria parasitica EP155]|uniref:Spindle assembly checkpoint component MAD1 n=1 Tax=Cryphonectria parasitica (strain ATCC 38755 / EP155) TaxID=660469 RepID=A0A9P4Y5Z0_CRYP1|nr:MAD-domain-containing protein [Cryphonectria parasitica EP155]KAF3766977.1 MAD-domain-containing protein [Cryphonectria parasitica EP155]